MIFQIVTKESNFVVASATYGDRREAEHWFDAFLEKNIHAYDYDRYILDEFLLDTIII